MGAPVIVQPFYGGFRRDEPRDLLPNGALWDCVDMVPQILGAPLRKRGAWTYSSPALTGGTSVLGLCRTPAFGSGEFNVAVTSDGGVDRFTDGAKTNVGTAFAVAQNPIVHRVDADTWLVIILAASGSTTPKSWDGTTFGNLGGTPPQAIFGDVWNDFAVVANGTVSSVRYAGRAWFGQQGASAAAWDTTSSWWDFSEPILGVAAMRNAILFFHKDSISRLRGTTPPGGTDEGDLKEDRPFDGIGIIDARSIAKYKDTVIWADGSGVHQTDGVAAKDLTGDGGISTYWFDLILSLDGNYTIAGGISHDTYLCSIMNGSTLVDTLCYDLLRGFWYRVSNVKAKCFMKVTGATAEKVYFGQGSAARVGSLHTFFHPDSGVAADDDTTVIAPVWETPFYRGMAGKQLSMSLQQWSNLFMSYDLRGTSPTIGVSFATDPGATSYTSLGTLAKTTAYKRAKLPIGKQAAGIAFKFAQSGGSTDTRFHALEAEYDQLEPSRLAQ